MIWTGRALSATRGTGASERTSVFAVFVIKSKNDERLPGLTPIPNQARLVICINRVVSETADYSFKTANGLIG